MAMTLADVEQAREVAAVIADDLGLIVWVNAEFERLFGWSRGEAIGQPISVLMPHRLRSPHHIGLTRFVRTGVPTIIGRTVVMPAILRSGVEFAAEHHIVAERRDGRWMFGATIRAVAKT